MAGVPAVEVILRRVAAEAVRPRAVAVTPLRVAEVIRHRAAARTLPAMVEDASLLLTLK